ncbi:MAG: YifB family Mg chelatase-like AAA ATPase [Polyangiaceae bacterium]|jgi:magnesium chelatase family protein|nr:YifB family Mg chelatase-like AAA ATPase [Polyangiaceae bacterium]
MLAATATTTLFGLEAHLVRVEVECCPGPSGFELVGLAETSVRESRVRIRSALAQLGVSLDEYRLVVNLAPGDVRKTGSGFDLAIALAALASLGRVPPEALAGWLLLGELSLAGDVRAVPGLLPQLLFARRLGFSSALVPAANGAEAAAVAGVRAWLAPTLRAVVDHFEHRAPLHRARPAEASGPPAEGDDLSEVRGQAAARRALEIAAAGHHHLLMIGPPGGGKTMLARRLASVLPPLSEDEALEVSAVHSVAGLLPPERGLITRRPFRSPHHTASDAGLVGGGYPPRPGELSLAHQGVLFLDELAEFRRSTLEALRQPLEDGELTIARARSRARFPARPLVVAASNPCPCGHYGDGRGRCSCSPEAVRRYLGRLSGPLLDRFDLHVALPPVDVSSLASPGSGEPSAAVRVRVERARAKQLERAQAGGLRGTTNAALSASELRIVATPDAEGMRLLLAAVDQLGLSARAYSKVLKVARTIADLAGDTNVSARQVAEALQLRPFDRVAAAPGLTRARPAEAAPETVRSFNGASRRGTPA